jgi:hypothetical protein
LEFSHYFFPADHTDSPFHGEEIKSLLNPRRPQKVTGFVEKNIGEKNIFRFLFHAIAEL